MVKLFIRKGILTICMNLSILLVGYFTIPYLSSEFIPSIQVPAVAVVFPTPLIPEKRVIEDIIRPVENAFFKTSELSSIETRVENERAIMILFYKWIYSPETCLRRARQVVENVKLPPEALAPIFVLHRPTSRPILRNIFYSNDILQVSKFAKALSVELERIAGISEITLPGSQLPRVELKIDPLKLARYKIKATDIIQTSRDSWSFRQFFPSSPIDHYIRLDIKNIEELGTLPLHKRGSDEPVLLRWLGEIRKEKGEPTVIYGKNEHAVILEIIKAPGADTVSIINTALQKINTAVNGQKTIKSKVIYNEAEKIVESQKGVFQNFIIGVLLNSFILIIFLGSPIGVLVASVVFPTALLGTLFAQKYLGISINLFSLNGFSLAVGMITDASTVVLESIARRFQASKKELFAACWKGTRDVSLGVLASTLTTAGVLIPIAMQKNISSKLFSDLSLTVVSTQLLCLIAVFSLVPWLCFKMFKPDDKPIGIINFFYKGTSIIVINMIKMAHYIQEKARQSKFARFTIPGGVVLFSLGMLAFLPKTEFLPAISSRVYSLNYPLASSLMKTQGTIIRNIFAQQLNEKENVLWSVSTYTQNNVEILFELNKVTPIQDIRNFFKNKMINNHKINIYAVGPAGAGEAYGYDGLFYISSSLPKSKKREFIKKFCSTDIIDDCLDKNLYKVFETRLSPQDITAVRMGSSSLTSISELAIPLRDLDLTGIGKLSFHLPTILKINQNNVMTQMPMNISGETVTSLGNLFEAKLRTKNSQFLRLDGKNYEPLYVRLKNSTLGEADTVMTSIKEKIFSSADAVLGRGTLATMNESFSSMMQALLLSALIILVILAIQFKSLKLALIIMGTIPLTLGGAITGLLIMNETVNASVMVGFILLIGIVVNNGIFLVEATNQKIADGYSMAEAVKESVSERTRPILMTSFSTIFGMLPTIILGGEGSELYRGMAIVNVFGMIVGTLLSIVITPIFIEFLGGKKCTE